MVLAFSVVMAALIWGDAAHRQGSGGLLSCSYFAIFIFFFRLLDIMFGLIGVTLLSSFLSRVHCCCVCCLHCTAASGCCFSLEALPHAPLPSGPLLAACLGDVALCDMLGNAPARAGVLHLAVDVKML